MNKIPDYMFTRKFLFLTVLFIVMFSILFLELYSPFSSTYWFTIDLTAEGGYMTLGTILMYAITILFLLSSKQSLINLHHKQGIGVLGIILFSISEVIVLTFFYTAITLLVLQNGTNPIRLFSKALPCIFLILIIPYTIAYLYGYAHGLKIESVNMPPRRDGTLVVSIHDNKGKIKLSLRIMDILYAVSEDNYVKVFYDQDGTVQNAIIRTTAKNIEDDLEGQITRCHRSYLINIARVRFFSNDRDNLYVIMDQEGINPIPVSRSYRDTVANLISGKA